MKTMARITVSTKDALRCSKRGCTYRGPLDRHHLRHEMMFIKVFEGKGKDKRYQSLIWRYEEFRPYDVRYLCRGHHGKIHEIYDTIIHSHRMKMKKFLSWYTWKEAINLMHTLRKTYFEWVRIEGKRSNPPTMRLSREGEKARML